MSQRLALPTDAEMFVLREYLIANGYNYDGSTGSNNACAKALASDYGWVESETKGAVGKNDYPEKRNATGFNGLPGGCRGSIFNDINYFGAWWSSSEFENSAMKMSLHYSLPVFYISIYPKEFGLSVRCIKD